MRKHGDKTTLVFLPADREAAWSLLPSSVSLLPGGTVQPENQVFLYPLGDWSCLRKPKKDKHQQQSQVPPAFTSLSLSQLIKQ